MPLTKFSNEELRNLKLEFDQLETIEEKFTFWPIRLNYEYSEVGVKVALNQVQDFLISTKSNDEIEELNFLILEEAQMLARRFRAKFNRSIVFDFDSEKSELDKKLKGAINPLPVLKKETNWIEAEVLKYETVPVKDLSYYTSDKFLWDDSIRGFWLAGYEGFTVRGTEPDLKRNVHSAPVLLALMNGFAVAQYKVYLEKLEWEFSQQRMTATQEETSRKQQLLILYHTGLLDKLNDLPVKDRNKLLAVLLNRSETNVRMDLNKIHKKGKTNSIRNEENLSFLFNLLQLTSFTEEAQKIKNELDELR